MHSGVHRTAGSLSSDPREATPIVPPVKYNIGHGHLTVVYVFVFATV